MNWQRTVGIDLALKSKHVAAGCNSHGAFVRKNPFRFGQTLQDYETLIKTFVEPNMKPEEVLFIMEATGNVWIPLSCFLISQGFKVCTIKTQKASDLRKFFNKYTKSDFNDAKAMSKQPFVDNNAMHQLILPKQQVFTLKRLVKQYAKYGDDISRYKNRIHAIFQLANPGLIDGLGENKFTQTARYFYKNFVNPLKVKKLGQSQFQKIMSKNTHGNSDPRVTTHMYEASISHCRLLQDLQTSMHEVPFNLDILQQEVRRELRHIHFIEKERNVIKKQIDALYKKLDPDKVLLDFQGIGTLIAPIILAFMGQFEKFSSINKIKAFLGFVPRKKQSAGTDRKGLRIIKDGPNIFKEHIYMAVETARHWDVQFAHRYHNLLRQGKHHKQAICALGNMLIARVFSIAKRRAKAFASGDIALAKSIRYQLRDLNGNPISKSEARAIILRDYPSTKNKQKKEKAPLASFDTGQSLDSPKRKSHIKPLPPKTSKPILTGV